LTNNSKEENRVQITFILDIGSSRYQYQRKHVVTWPECRNCRSKHAPRLRWSLTYTWLVGVWFWANYTERRDGSFWRPQAVTGQGLT